MKAIIALLANVTASSLTTSVEQTTFPLPDDGEYSRAFMTSGKITIIVSTSTGTDIPLKKMSIEVALPWNALLDVVDAPITVLSGEVPGSSTLNIDIESLDAALSASNTNEKLSHLQYPGKLTSDRLKLFYVPQSPQ